MLRVVLVVGFLVLSSCLGVVAAEPLSFPPTLPGTEPLTIAEPLDEVMVAGIDRFALRAIAQAARERAGRWKRDTSSPEAYQMSLEPYRERFRQILGIVDPRIAGRGIEDLSLTSLTGMEMPGTRFARNEDELYSILPVRWQVLDGVTAEGLVLEPVVDEIVGAVIAIPDATWTPEEFCGADPDKPEATPMARWFAEQGLLVVIPTLLSRDDTFAGNPDVAMTNQSHREWVYRQAFELGRHVIGYEVQKVLAAVDALERFNKDVEADLPIGVAGVGEGGLLALSAAALDPRIDAALVSGYVQPREHVWEEPIDRNVWNLLTEFGDAEIAGMIAPRPLIVEACAVPDVTTPLPVTPGRRGGAAPGQIRTADVAAVRAEFERAREIYASIREDEQLQLVVSGPQGTGPAGSTRALRTFLAALEIEEVDVAPGDPLKLNAEVDAETRQQRQVQELVNFTQRLLRLCYKTRDKRWGAADKSSVAAWEQSADTLRNQVWDELIGRIPDPVLPPAPRTRKILETPEYHGYDVVVDVFPDVIASGVLLLPADLKAGEQRPVVVCQHGLEGTPMDTIGGPGTPGYPPYKAFSAELAKQGFIVYAPQNPYRGKDRFRTLQRKSNPLGRSLFSYILPQHQATLAWLKTQPWVDPERIAFYGLSYGGKTAVRVPPLLPDYCLSICSADYNEWVYKNATIDSPRSYLYTGEYEIFEWNMGHVANYAELASLMAPRPFMVERGHDDGVADDEWVAWEYAKVRRHYAKLGLADRTEIEFFNGPHTINGQGTFSFLRRHLRGEQ
uniref:Dienelactone hydrolase domain-containing protein n=1 Tax=Schlesneria paludicola TaxID=360056 RepID=A0A7C2JZ78_9PLAN